MLKGIQSRFSQLQGLLLPRKCINCQAISPHGFCMNCRKLLPWITCPCETCGREISQPGICGRCLSRPPPFDFTVIPFLYQEPVSTRIHQLKYAGHLYIANALGQLLGERILKNSRDLPDTIVAIPLHWRKTCRRGFNQSSEIAKAASNILGIPLHYSLLRRTVNTMSQTGLSEKNRLANMRGAFSVPERYRNGDTGSRHVALVDDVVTSGGTVTAAARALKRAGIGKVTVWAVAKTTTPDSG